jgi:hypothetical protein
VLEARSISMDPTQWWRDEVEFNDEPELPMAITLTIAVVIISATFLAAYSAMGFGEAVFREVNPMAKQVVCHFHVALLDVAVQLPHAAPLAHPLTLDHHLTWLPSS